MIISASRRTDLPAFYATWLLKRLEEGYCLVPNPLNPKQVSRVSLSPEDVDAIVFWTKNPAPLLPALPALASYAYYFQFTLTPYGRNIEPGLPPKRELIKTFKVLSRELGRHRIVWRYDPILLTSEWTGEHHVRAFAELLAELTPYTDTCVLSFVDLYQKTERNTRSLGLLPLTREKMREIAARFAAFARGTGVQLQSCAEELDLEDFGIEHGACIDKARLEKVIGRRIADTRSARKDPTQRSVCQCLASVDIGMYNTCRHLCKYCYANFSPAEVAAHATSHDPASPLLMGRLHPAAVIRDRAVTHLNFLTAQDYVESSLF
jgi:DNA repair photolyase